MTLPPGLVAISLVKGCVLLLTEQEYARALRPGKAWPRRAALARRQEKPPEAPPDSGRVTDYPQAVPGAAPAPGILGDQEQAARGG